MKKELYTLVAFFVISLPSFSQGSFFWTRNHKVMLTADSSQILVKAKEKAEITGLMDNIKQSDPEADVTQLSIGGESFVLVKKHGVNKNVQRIEYQHSDFQIPVFHGEDYIPYYFNGDIIFRPKQGINLEQISQIVNNGIYLKGSVSNKTYFFRVGKGENVLDVSNKIHESGLVEWCHPSDWV